MLREKIKELQAWKASPFRKPLVLRGARQVGKTWLLQEFGNKEYARTIYVNFEDTPALQSIFEQDFDIDRILNILQIHAQTPINLENTLLVLDEIQSAKRGITSLKYFCEKKPELHLVAAGSLLGMGLHYQESFPVGKVDFMDLWPLSFTEFLMALGEEGLTTALQSRDWPTVSVFHQKLIEYLRYYLYTGGMPEVVETFVRTRDWQAVRQIQQRLLLSYEGDFSKHAPAEIVPRIRMVWNNIPAQLAKENKKFVYGALKDGARAKDFELAIQWLLDTGLLLKSCKISKPGLPLSAYQDYSAFKLYLLDVGLLGAMAGIQVQTIISGDALFSEFKGTLTEQFVMQQLRQNSQRLIGYWTNDRNTSEVDFIIQDKDQIIPIEVKSGENLHAKSFKLFCEKFKPGCAIRTSLSKYQEESWMVNIPLYGMGGLT